MALTLYKWASGPIEIFSLEMRNPILENSWNALSAVESEQHKTWYQTYLYLSKKKKIKKKFDIRLIYGSFYFFAD